MFSIQATATALLAARDLHDPDADPDENPEYTRGQAELIMNTFHIASSSKEDVYAFIGHQTDTLDLTVTVTHEDLSKLVREERRG